MTLIDNLEWRYATKKFDASKKVSTQHIELLKKAIQLAPSSYGLQLYTISGTITTSKGTAQYRMLANKGTAGSGKAKAKGHIIPLK